MQSREIDLGVIYILVREEALQTDELSEKTGGEGKDKDLVTHFCFKTYGCQGLRGWTVD